MPKDRGQQRAIDLQAQVVKVPSRPFPGGPVPSAALVASVSEYGGDTDRIYRGNVAWQQQAWDYYNTTPELRFAAAWIGNALSRCLVAAGEVNSDGDTVASENTAIKAALKELFNGKDSTASMLNAFGIHLTVAGEAYLVGRRMNVVGPTGQPMVSDKLIWEVVGVNELSGTGGVWIIDYSSDREDKIRLTADDVVIRVWRPHPAKRIEADSPVRTLLPVLTEIEYLTRHIFSQTQSRLAGAGVWVVPNDVEFPGSDKALNKAESLSKGLGKSMAAPLNTPGTVAELVPFIVTAPPESVDKFREPIHFWSPFDEKAVEARKEAVLRFCVGMDIPPEVILGMTQGASSSGGTGTGASHWTAWQIEESAIKLHIEPLLEVIVYGIVIGYLRKVTKNPAAAIITDTTPLKLQPDRSREAIELNDRGLLSAKATRKHTGFTEDEAMDDAELLQWRYGRIAASAVTPEQVAYALTMLTGDKNFPTSADQQDTLHPGTNQPPAPAMDEHPVGRGAPQGASIILAAEALCLRALERAGNRLRNGGLQPDCPPHETHRFAATITDPEKLLEDAWSTLPVVFDGAGDDGIRKLQLVLHEYTKMLLVTHQPHNRAALVRYVSQIGEAA